MDVFSAKVKMVDLVIDLNLPMSSLDKFSKGMKKMFHDSKIGKSFQCARILVFVREMSLKFEFGGRHACHVVQLYSSTDFTRDL